MKRFIFIILFSWIWAAAAQQAVVLKVSDGFTGEPVAGASVEKDGKKIAVTDRNGTCRLEVKAGDRLVVKAQGYEELELEVPTRLPRVWEVHLMPESVRLDQVVITSDPLRTPVHAVVSQDIEKKYSQPRNTAELFKDMPGFSLQKRSAMSTEPSLRAFKYEEMNLIYDGGFKMVNACPNRMDPAPAHVIPEEVEKIEVIKGPFNVRFGQTFGAVVNMQTRRGAPEKKGLSGLLQGGYETNGSNKVGLASLTYAREKFDVSSTLSYRDFGDYVDGKGDTVPAGFRSLEYSVKTGFTPRKERRLLLDWRQNFTRNVKHPGLPMDSPKDDSYLIGVDYYAGKISPKIRAFTAKAYYSYVDHLMTNGYLMDKPRPNYPTFDARTPVWSRTAGMKAESEYQPKKNLLVYVGASADGIARDGTKTVLITRNPNTGEPWPVKKKVMKVWQDARITDYGAYAQGSWSKDRRNIFGAGIRVDYVRAEARDPDPGMIALYGNFGPRVDMVLSANFSYIYKRPDYRIEAAVGRGARTPNMIERYIYRFVISEDSREYIGNPFLKPEINNQVEISGIRQWGAFRAGADVFASYFQNYITAVLRSDWTPDTGSCGNPPKAPKQFVNVDAYQYGADIFASYDLTEAWRLSADFSYIKAYNLTLNEPLAQINPPGGHIKVRFRQPRYWVDYRVELRAPKTDVAKSFDEHPTPGYAVHDVMAGWKPNEHWTLGLSVTNIFDAAYYYHTTFVFRNAGPRTGEKIYEPGRNIGMMVTYKF